MKLLPGWLRGWWGNSQLTPTSRLPVIQIEITSRRHQPHLHLLKQSTCSKITSYFCGGFTPNFHSKVRSYLWTSAETPL
jgi:hypothetical protein